MGLKVIHSPKVLFQWGNPSYCSWCGKEGQNEGTVVNHLRTVHYYLGLICALCQDFFTMSSDTLRWHTSSYESLPMDDKDWQEEEESKGDNVDEDDGYQLEEI